jgi:urate oxidase/2-oxo-4-hydroxy-4-carboxy-5-ureidoimidazoline decarboxylase
MNRFATGVKKNYYGKGDVSVYRLNRQGGVTGRGIFAANVMILVYGDAFWPTYTTGDNTGLVATDSMKNFIQRETMNFEDDDLESYCRFIGEKFLKTYPQTEGAQVSATEIPYRALDGVGGLSFCPGGPEKVFARIEIVREESSFVIAEAVSGIVGFKLLRLTGSSFTGFVRDQYTTLPDTADRPLNMWLDLDWTYTDVAGAFSRGVTTSRVRELVLDTFEKFTSGSIQQIIYQIGCRMLAEVPSIAEINLEANNRTWDAVVNDGGPMSLYTDPRPPYGCLGLTLRR